jgi:pimeloyl-ACP methyl ester carboxylesterase
MNKMETNDAATIVMIHGMCCGPWYWQNFKDFFEKRGFQCICPTLRYHDAEFKEPPHPYLGSTSILDYADDLEQQIRSLQTPPILMGHSMGGLLVQILASRGLADQAVLLSPAPPRGIIALRPSAVRSFFSGLMRWGFWKKPFRQTFTEASYSVLHFLPAEERLQVYHRLVYESGRAACEIGFWFFDPQKATTVDAALVQCPTLVVGAHRDRLISLSVTRQVAQKYSRVATYKEFTNHSHWLLAEPGWQEVAGYVADWLKQHVDR